MSAPDRYAAYVTTCAAGGVLPCSYEAFAADEARACPATDAGIPASVQANALGQAQDQGGREGGHLMQAQLPETRMDTGPAPGLVVGTNTSAVTQIAEDLRRASASAKAQGDPGKLIVMGGRQFNAQALLDLQHDAARYRWLRDKADGMLGVAAPMVASLDQAGRVTTLLDGDDLDAAVDMAMAAPAEKRQRKTKRVGTDK